MLMFSACLDAGGALKQQALTSLILLTIVQNSIVTTAATKLAQAP